MKHPHCDLIKAWADGAAIEIQLGNGCWNELERPSWQPSSTYRIKPEPKPDIPQTFHVGWSSLRKSCLWHQSALHNLQLVFDGETGKLKQANIL